MYFKLAINVNLYILNCTIFFSIQFRLKSFSFNFYINRYNLGLFVL